MTADAPTPDEVRRIAAIADPVLRNLEITLAYSRLAAAVAARTGEGANWCVYATWASRQAGRTIRGEDLLADLERRLGRRRGRLLHPFRSLWRALLRRGLLRPESRLGRVTAQLHTPFDAVERASDAVARGNLKVFAEIGLEFARYLSECPPDAPPGAAALRAFVGGLRPGEPPDGQRLLRQAFARYDRVRAGDGRPERAGLALLANLEIGLHEQTRLQPEIREALDAPGATGERLGGRALAAAFPRLAARGTLVRGPAAALAGVLARRLERAGGAVARETITASFLTLALPWRVLSLGTHLADPAAGELAEPTDPELVELLAHLEPAGRGPDDCGARDWSDLGQRMHYISHLFRAFHADARLFEPPFTADQVESLRRGVVPAGVL